MSSSFTCILLFCINYRILFHILLSSYLNHCNTVLLPRKNIEYLLQVSKLGWSNNSLITFSLLYLMHKSKYCLQKIFYDLFLHHFLSVCPLFPHDYFYLLSSMQSIILYFVHWHLLKGLYPNLQYFCIPSH